MERKNIPNLCQKYNKNHFVNQRKNFITYSKTQLKFQISVTNEPYAQTKYKCIKAKVTWTLSKNAEKTEKEGSTLFEVPTYQSTIS